MARVAAPLLGWSIALWLMVLLAACSTRGDLDIDAADSPTGPPPLPNGYAVWASLEEAAPHLVSETDADQWLGLLRQRGVASVYLAARTVTGDAAWPSTSAPLFNGRGDQLHIATTSGRRVGVEIVAVFPAFLAPPGPGEEIATYGWSSADRMARLRSWPAGEMPRISPATRSARSRQLALLRELARENIDALCISHAGFPSMDADFSDAARDAFSRDTGLSVADWPESIVRFDPPPTEDATPIATEGIHNEAWRLWRGAVVADFLTQAAALARGEHDRAGRGELRLSLLAPGYYPLHLREGINWAWRERALNWVLTDLPPGTEQIPVGQHFDEIILETLVPVARAETAASLDLAWWSSIEGALRVAGPLVGDGQSVRIALASFPYATLAEDEEGVGSGAEFSALERRAFTEALRAASQSGRMPLVLDRHDLDGFVDQDALAGRRQ